MEIATHNLFIETDGARLLSNVSVNIGRGDFVGVVGPNGAGKTTLLRALAGLTKPDRGAVYLDGQDLQAIGPIALARLRAYLAQDRRSYWDMRAGDIVALGRYAFGIPAEGTTTPRPGTSGADRRAIDEALHITGMTAFSTRPMATLSGGEAARVHLARALAGQTPILIADEPAANLDPAQALSVMRLLRAKADNGGLVIAALHDLTLARRFCSRVMIMDKAEMIADGPPTDIMTPDLLQRVFALNSDDCALLGLNSL